MDTIKFYQLANLLDLAYDGDETDLRLHGKEILNWGAETEEEYNQVTESIDAISYEGNGWHVYAWYDVSGYDYWMIQQEEPNYINITVSFDSDEVDRDEIPNIQKAIDSAYEEAYAISEMHYYPRYKRGGSIKYNTGRSWHLDRQKHNKSEDWEKPMSKRKKRYEIGGGVDYLSKNDFKINFDHPYYNYEKEYQLASQFNYNDVKIKSAKGLIDEDGIDVEINFSNGMIMDIRQVGGGEIGELSNATLRSGVRDSYPYKTATLDFHYQLNKAESFIGAVKLVFEYLYNDVKIKFAGGGGVGVLKKFGFNLGILKNKYEKDEYIDTELLKKDGYNRVYYNGLISEWYNSENGNRLVYSTLPSYRDWKVGQSKSYSKILILSKNQSDITAYKEQIDYGRNLVHNKEDYDYALEQGHNFATGGGVGDYKITLKSWDALVYEDDYNEGEGEQVNSFSERVNKSFSNTEDFFKYINDNVLYYNMNKEYFSIMDDGRIVTSLLVDEDNSAASKSEIGEWEKGNKKLYSANYNFYVTLTKEKTPTANELSELLGIGVYKQGGSIKGHYNSGRSWHLDRQKHNKSEDWEKPMRKRKKRYAIGGGVDLQDKIIDGDLVKFKDDAENIFNEKGYYWKWYLNEKLKNKEVFKVTGIRNDGDSIIEFLGDTGIYDEDRTRIGSIPLSIHAPLDSLQKVSNNKMAEGGGVGTDVYDFDKKMALINLDMIHEYSVKLDNMVTEETELEEWVKMKLTRIEQNIADIKHSLAGWEKFSEGGMIFKKQLLHISKYAKDLIDMIQSGSKLMSWQENKLAVSADYIDGIYHHMDYIRKRDTEKLDEYLGKYSKGGGINSGRDNLFKSQEPHEQKYNRKREWKEYKKENWFGDWFRDGGGVGKKTQISQIEVEDELNGKEKPISVEKISNEFYGITGINYIYDNNYNHIAVMVYTENLGSIGVSELNNIRKRLGADDLQVSIISLNKKLDGDGIIYILFYKNGKKFSNGGGIEDNFDYGSDLTDEAMVKDNLMNGEISCETLTKIIGCKPSYPYQIVGAIKLEKCYLRPYYKLA